MRRAYNHFRGRFSSRFRGRLRGWLRAFSLSAALAAGAPASSDEALVAVVIDDLGNRRDLGLAAVELPGPVTYAVLPYTAHGPAIARLAHALDKDVLVHLPMEATSRRRLGPGGLTGRLSRAEFHARAEEALASVPHARGVNNHMGSRLTAMRRPMDWLMTILAARPGWIFLDSRTTARTIAERAARDAGVGTTFRDVFLDNVAEEPAISRQLDELVERARRQGTAVAIGHPYPQTLRVLGDELPRLAARGVRLVSLKTIIARRATRCCARAVRVSQSSGHAATMHHTPIAPSTQLRNGAPATISGWKPSRP